MATEPGFEEVPGLSLDAVVVNRLLGRHGVPPRKRVSALEALGWSYQQARRRVNGEVDWTLDDLKIVAEHFGETLESLVAVNTHSSGLDAELIAGPLRLPCLLWVSEQEPITGRPGPLVATRLVTGDWLVVPAVEAGATPSYEVARLLFQRGHKPAKRVAILDDDEELAVGMTEYMTHIGIKATSFFSMSELLSAVAAHPFDGYVLDWLIGSDNARPLITEIRATDAVSPIIVLTGQLRAGRVDESELSTLAASHRLQYMEKPCRIPAIVSALELGFERRL